MQLMHLERIPRPLRNQITLQPRSRFATEFTAKISCVSYFPSDNPRAALSMSQTRKHSFAKHFLVSVYFERTDYLNPRISARASHTWLHINPPRGFKWSIATSVVEAISSAREHSGETRRQVETEGGIKGKQKAPFQKSALSKRRQSSRRAGFSVGRPRTLECKSTRSPARQG